MLEQFGDLKYENNAEEINHFVDSLLRIIFNGVRKKENGGGLP